VTLIFDSGLEHSPSTHVLAIGVGRYPHLLGGEAALAANPLGLRQLTSPPVSLRAVSDWFMRPLIHAGQVGFVNEDAPLGTLHAVASAFQSVEVLTPNGLIGAPPATMANIEAAFASWLQCLKRNPSNLGVFYFCGHGIMVSDHYLLAEDFGAGLNPWSKAFDISNTIRAVEREVGGALYFFIDACREVSRELALSVGATLHPSSPPMSLQEYLGL
jgi:Caspase domain